MRTVIWMACNLAGWWYGIEPATLERIAWRESRYHCEAVRGPCTGCFQVDRRYSRLTVAQLKTPLGGALEAARLLRWGQRHCGDDGLRWYATGRCR